MKRLVLRASGLACLLAITACQAVWKYSMIETEHVKVSAEGVRFSSDKFQTTLNAGAIAVQGKKESPICDVEVEIVAGTTKKTIHRSAGKFKGFRDHNVALYVERKITEAQLVIRGRPCEDKKAPKQIILVADITRGGLGARSAKPDGGAIRVATRAGQPHFVEVAVGGGRVRLTAGDLRAVRSSLRDFYARSGGLRGKPDFLGAAVFADGHFLAWLSGPGSGYAELPVMRGQLKRLQIVSLDTGLRVVGNWRFDNMRF